ncbi:MAG TPA: M20 family metallopeptidase [Pyrinomonadaceae bacterium]|nr:M20 family metallopeptidase [Pyrinomonadaceae bacterium]
MPDRIPKAQATTFREYFHNRQTELVALTRALVEAESPSGDLAGSKAVVSLLAAAARTIPAVTAIERVASENYGEHLRLKAFSTGGRKEEPPIVILGHTDTVHARGSLEKRPWRVEGNRAYGPGVFDMKANCALAIETIRALSSLNIPPSQPLVLLLTCDEETGSMTGRSLVETESRRSRAVLVLEPPASGGRVKTGRKGTGIFSIQTRGRAAHAGLEPEKGASAILEMARQVDRLHGMNSRGGITVNVGVIQGGTLSNVVPAEAHAEVDVRFSTDEEGKWIEQQITNLRPFDERVQLVVRGGINRPPLERTERVVALYEHARGVAAMFDHDLAEAQVGGASDGNFAAAMGASVLDGLGIDGDGAHAIHEHIRLDDIPVRGAILAGLISTL